MCIYVNMFVLSMHINLFVINEYLFTHTYVVENIYVRMFDFYILKELVYYKEISGKLSSYEIPDYPLYKLQWLLFVSVHANTIPAG